MYVFLFFFDILGGDRESETPDQLP
jgi:hypothetical protein